MSEITNDINAVKILVTGSSGFLGERIVEELLDENSPISVQKIIALDRKAFTGPKNEKIEFVLGDVGDIALLEKLTKDVDIVIHSAAIIDWGTKSPDEVLETNLWGTKNIINAAKKNGVKYLLYTSSLDAVYSGKALVDIDESHAYPDKHANVYCESKHLSELEVQKANDEGLISCILRPCDIFGEKDPYHIEPLINMAKSGFYVRLGNGTAKCQHIYVGNMAYAHVLAASALWKGNKKIAGEIYFITDGTGNNFFSFYDQIVEGAGYSISPKKMWIPKGIAYAMGAVSEWMAIMVRPIKKYNPKFSRFAVSYTCTDFTFSSEKAMKDFGYRAKYDHEQAIQNTIAFYKK